MEGSTQEEITITKSTTARLIFLGPKLSGYKQFVSFFKEKKKFKKNNSFAVNNNTVNSNNNNNKNRINGDRHLPPRTQTRYPSCI